MPCPVCSTAGKTKVDNKNCPKKLGGYKVCEKPIWRCDKNPDHKYCVEHGTGWNR
jgi:hypothetical protein